MLRELQRPYVGGDGPAVVGGHLRRVARHLPEPLGHDVEEVADRLLAQTIDVERRGVLEAALDDHAQAVALFAVAGNRRC